MPESKFVTDRRRRDRFDSEISEAPPQPGFDWRNPIPESTAEEVVGSLPGPLRRGAHAIGRGLQALQAPPEHPGLSPQQLAAPPRGGVMAVGAPPRSQAPPTMDPNPAKTQDRANTEAIAIAAVRAAAAGDLNREKVATPAPSADEKKPAIGTGPGAVAAVPPRPAGTGGTGATPGPGRTQVKMPDGRFVFVTPDRGADYVAGGGDYASYQDATGGLGAPQAARFMRDRTSRVDVPGSERLPYSEQVRGLASAPPETPLSFEGDAGFGMAPAGSGGPAEGYRRLSGIEQALARRTWLEGRAGMEQAQETERAEVDRRTRLAEMDPLEMARIQAQGRMGGDIAKVQLDLRARQQAAAEFRRVSEQIVAAMQDPEVSERYINYLIQTRKDLSNILLGERLTDPRAAADAFGTALAGLGLADDGGVPPAGAR
jgi:hypothetical protein